MKLLEPWFKKIMKQYKIKFAMNIYNHMNKVSKADSMSSACWAKPGEP